MIVQTPPRRHRPPFSQCAWCPCPAGAAVTGLISIGESVNAATAATSSHATHRKINLTVMLPIKAVRPAVL